MATIQLLPKEVEVLKAFPDDGAVLIAHLALATKQTPGEVESSLERLVVKGLVDRTVEGLARLTNLGVGTRSVLTRGLAQVADDLGSIEKLDPPPLGAGHQNGHKSAAPKLQFVEQSQGVGASIAGAVTGFLIGGPIGGIFGGFLGALAGATVGGTIGNIAGRQFEHESEEPRVEILPDAATRSGGDSASAGAGV